MARLFTMMLVFILTGAHAQSFHKFPHSKAALISKFSAQPIGGENVLGIWIQLDPHWHTYWRNPGDSGSRPTFNITSKDATITAGELRWPTPKRISTPPLNTFGYDNEVLFQIPIKIEKLINTSAKTIRVDVASEWLVCENECVPALGTLHADIAIKPSATLSAEAPYFLERENYFPDTAVMDAHYSVKEKGLSVILPEQAEGIEDFFPLETAEIKSSAPIFKTVSNGLEMNLTTFEPWSKPYAGDLGLAVFKGDVKRAQMVRVVPQAAAAPLQSWIYYLGLAILGGLLLNLMPCVFPVLFMKMMGLSRMNAHSGKKIAFAYSAGVVGSMLLLSVALYVLKASGAKLGWGFQLQNPSFVLVLLVLSWLIALGFLGVLNFQIPYLSHIAKVSSRNVYVNEFFTGILAVVLASPCTAPFMGSALGFAFTQNFWIQQCIFIGLALGIALPFIACALQPKIIAFLPKPGAWMDKFRALLAFPMLLTTLWLGHVLSAQTSAAQTWITFSVLVCASAVLWALSWTQARSTKIVLGFLLLASFLGLWTTRGKSSIPSSQKLTWEKFSPQKIESARAQQPVFVDFTAEWCLSCKVNEALTFERDKTVTAVQQHKILMLKADWTNKDPIITTVLESYGRAGVPLYLLFIPGRVDPVIFPQILTAEIFVSLIEKELR